ncbi:MAG: bifunctional 5,10-methylenetetrahydrofolate dehydrogenase/5,10-methenyltetrahydrofolate cyclohydrolase [bacterium]|nr:bifunctional 5,10-methylenetetrahydrofolate dehydrogenase/5,10-methenyltetrahydrofolate cyclohydrolase [bacterium]
MKILDGKKIADRILARLGKIIKKRRLKLKLAAVLVGNDPASLSFVGRKKQACEKIGIAFSLYQFPVTISRQKLEREIQRIAKNPAISGAIIQLPLPKSIDTDFVLNLLPPKKDVDCLGRRSLEKFREEKSLILPPVVDAVAKLTQAFGIKFAGKKVLVIGKGRLVGQPLMVWLPKQGAIVLTADKSTKDLAGLCLKADIIISGVGKPSLIRGEMIKKGAVIIDVGSSKKAGQIVGDVNFESCAKIARAISPVPGGVGPLTVACLLENLLILSGN